MKLFNWKGIDKSGINKKGKTLAKNPNELENILLKQGIALLKIKTNLFKLSKKTLTLNVSFDNVRVIINKIIAQRKTNPEKLISLFQGLSFLLGNGISLTNSLNLISKQIKNRNLRNIIILLELDISNGKTLSEAMEIHPIFNSFTVWMVESGEKTGKLSFILNQLAKFMGIKQKNSRKIREAALLPMITLFFALFIVFIIFIFIVPQFETLFTTSNKTLPTSTKFILKISHFLRFDLGIFELSALFISLLFLKLISLTHQAKKLFDYISLRLFFIKEIVLNLNLLFFLNTLSLCLKSGINIKQSLFHAKSMSSNYIFKEKINLLEKLVSEGKSFTEALTIAGNNYFPEDLIAAINVGEESGNLDNVLKRQVSRLQHKLKSKLSLLTTIIQPILMIFVGLLIAFIIYAVYLPIFNISNSF